MLELDEAYLTVVARQSPSRAMSPESGRTERKSAFEQKTKRTSALAACDTLCRSDQSAS